MVECLFMVRWVVRSIPQVGEIELFVPPVFHDWCNKGHGMCYPVYGLVHINKPFLLIRISSYLSGHLPYAM